MWTIPITLLLIAAALALLWLSHRQRRATGLPGGRVIYTDTQKWGEVKEPFYDSALGLTGKPDYLVEHGKEIIPVEVKSSRAPYGPYDAHIMQLAAYCLLVERHFHKRPSHGILNYTDHTYRIDYTPELEQALRATLVDMRAQEYQREGHRSHGSPARCRGCGYRSTCQEKLS
jgi:CRISPR-associated exonuclease Cas4